MQKLAGDRLNEPSALPDLGATGNDFPVRLEETADCIVPAILLGWSEVMRMMHTASAAYATEYPAFTAFAAISMSSLISVFPKPPSSIYALRRYAEHTSVAKYALIPMVTTSALERTLDSGP